VILPTNQVTKKFGKGKVLGRTYHKPYSLELVMALYYTVGAYTKLVAISINWQKLVGKS
jgi:hypothetical protein